MFGRHRAPDPSYRRSQAITTLPVRPSPEACRDVMQLLRVSDDHGDRLSLAQSLVDELNRLAGLPACTVIVANRPQVHRHDGQRLQSKTYGYYRCWLIDGTVSRARIRIYNQTAVRRQVITPKVLINTVLHEWTHHYDFAGLRLPRSPHTSGFYARLRALGAALEVDFVFPPDPAAIVATG